MKKTNQKIFTAIENKNDGFYLKSYFLGVFSSYGRALNRIITERKKVRKEKGSHVLEEDYSWYIEEQILDMPETAKLNEVSIEKVWIYR